MKNLTKDVEVRTWEEYKMIIFQEVLSKEENLFDYCPTDPAPLLLILDRRDDPITPLLSQVSQTVLKKFLKYSGW